MSETIFSKIIRREIPADIVYEDEKVLAFRDINPKAPIHILIIPKILIPKISEFKSKDHSEYLIAMFEAVNKIAEQEGLKENGFRLVINNGENGGQEVMHLHIHLLGGKKLSWNPG